MVDNPFICERRDHGEGIDNSPGRNLTRGNTRRLVRSSSISSDYKRQTNSIHSSSSSSNRRVVRSNGRKIVRSSSIPRDFRTHDKTDSGRRSSSNTGEMKRSSSMSSTSCTNAERRPPSSKGNQIMRSVAAFFSRGSKGQTRRLRSFPLTRPASPSSVATLSRSNSDSSSSTTQGEGSSEAEGSRGGATSHSKASRPQVSFDVEVQTVFIEQMKEEEVRNTFYCRTEYVAFKEAYRTHRDTSTGWCRGNDVLPCSCDSCRDDLSEGGQHAHASTPPDLSEDDSPVPVGTLPPRPSPPLSPNELTDNRDKAKGDDGQQDEPPSPVGAVFQEGGNTRSSSDSDEAVAKPRAARRARAAPRRPASKHGRSRTWGMGSVPIAAPSAGMAIKRGGSLDDWGATSRVRAAVKCHGEDYAYDTLRHQGFSDLYIKTHFLPKS